MSEELLRKATEMRNAIDMIEGALMGLGDFVDLPDLFEGTAEHVHLAPKMTVGEMRRVCTALAECTRIINSDEFDPDQLRRHAQCAPWQPIETAPQDRTWVLVWEAGINEKYHPAEVARFVNNRWESSAMKYVNAVYWMPIPALTSTDRCSQASEIERCQDCGQELPIRYPCHEQGCTIKCRF